MLEGKQSVTFITVEDASKFLTQLQALINHIGDYLTGSDFRTRGRSPDFVRKRCTLVFKQVQVGSLRAELDLEDTQTTLTGAPTLGEESIEKFHELISTVHRGKDMESRFKVMIE